MSASAAKPRIALRVGIVLLLVIAAGVFAFIRFRPVATVATVTIGTAVDAVTGSVVVHAEKDLQDIKSEMSGRVIWVDPRQLGEPFKAGEPIVKLDSSDLERQLKQRKTDFEADLEKTKIQKQSDARLVQAKERLAVAELRHNRGEMSETDWKNAQHDYQQVETTLQLEEFDAKQRKLSFDNAQADLQRQIDKMTIRAPMDGIAQAVFVAPGALIGGGTTVATFFSNQRVIIAKVGEDDIGRVKVGDHAKVRLLNLGDDMLDAKVTTILPFADPDTQRYSVYLEVKADPAKLKPFSTGEATITVREQPNMPLIPRRALFNDDYVFVVTNGVVEKRKISVGIKALNFAEVTGNMKPGEQVIVDDVDQFRDGEHVRTLVAQ